MEHSVSLPSECNESDILCHSLAQSDQRALIFHLLYAADAFDYDVSLESIADNFSRGFGITIPTDSDVFKKAQAIIDQREYLDTIIKPLLDNWRFERLGTATRLIMRMGIWELLNTDTERTIVINEAIELAKCFAEKDAYKFINGVLDQVVKENISKESA